jgi:hypothetical protein
MADIAEAVYPVTDRGIGYKLFSRGLLPVQAAHGQGLPVA